MNFNVELRLRLETKKKFIVGAGGLSVKIKSDAPFLRVRGKGGSKLLVPGSTIKGVLRTSLIRISNLLGYRRVTETVYPNKIGSKLDIVTNLFGKPHGPESKIFVGSALLDEETNTLTHVKIDDATKIAEEMGLFTAEYLSIKKRFYVDLKGFNLNIEEFRALMASIAELNYERIGRNGAVGVKIVKEKSKVPREVLRDPLVKAIWEELSLEDI